MFYFIAYGSLICGISRKAWIGKQRIGRLPIWVRKVKCRSSATVIQDVSKNRDGCPVRGTSCQRWGDVEAPDLGAMAVGVWEQDLRVGVERGGDKPEH